ncbi:hypothetical protein [Allosphingosinicella sp.]|uniref:hypothetical protein n=1 Tax=Allosphingosinicella sp. TaxID=2823234 RepID=UPI003783C4BC
MRDSDWNTFESQIPRATHFRLRAAFKRFCAGCDDLPDQLFHRCPQDGHGRLEEFVADGVRVIGRRGTDETIQTFFVIEFRVAADAPPLAVVPAPAQAMLPLPINQPQRGTER